eukprot:CAMPEP_0172503882 /NCGR_PEP_ID=MMETSP1066-20121228/173345_1 /TAXON_ID=671091 /ORGANISM="Coscinodiscus wailesii, Strain CCMP2513" /LENGTH=131 /DNA_ID=CAMNT_0013279809 /DNA_START=83 /DNA_END=475 /DNA_ORIENTATION=-
MSSRLGTFIWISDLHFDSHYGTPLAYHSSSGGTSTCGTSDNPTIGIYGCDSPLALLISTLSYAANTLPDPDFVLVTGDTLRHGGENLPNAMDEVYSGTHDVAGYLREYFPEVMILYTIGNNDVLPDYHLEV